MTTDYRFFPPYDNFKKVLQNCPKSALLYAALWKTKENKLLLKVRRQDINRRFLISPTLFRNQLATLMKIDILSFEETRDLFLIVFEDQNA